MKINRVILSVNNNPTYSRFWGIVSKVWRNNFNITPTLIFNGTKSEFESNNFGVPEQDCIIVDKIAQVSESSPDWSVTWSLFWGASQFPNDVCLLSGIDQIPLGDFFFKKLLEFSDDKFIIGFADAYRSYNKNTLGYFNTVTNVLFPSSHLVGKGEKFKEIFGIEDTWENEVVKVHDSRGRYHLQNKFYPGKLWGLDECYSSEKISTFEKQEELIYLDIFWSYWEKNRIDFCGKINHNYNMNLVKEGYYSEITTKQYDIYKAQIENVINNSPIYNF